MSSSENVKKGEKLEAKVDSELKGFTQWLVNLSNKLPKFPENVVQWFVAYLPVINVIFAILGVFQALGYLFVTAALSFAGIFTFGIAFIFAFITLIIFAFVVTRTTLLFLSYSPLKQKSKKGWKYTYWANLMGVFASILSLFTTQPNSTNFFSWLLSTFLLIVVPLAFLHLILQIRKEYK